MLGHDIAVATASVVCMLKGRDDDTDRWGAVAQVFYAACQGLLYVLCYRLEQLMEAPAAAAAGTSPTGTDAGAGAQVIRQLFTDVMPKLLHHRYLTLPCYPCGV